MTVGDEDYAAIYGGEAVYHDGEVVSRLRSCAYGFTARANIAYAYLPVALTPGASVEVEVFGRMVPATVREDALIAKPAGRVRDAVGGAG